MKRLRPAWIAAALALGACAHHDSSALAPRAADAPYTGLPVQYPRAQPVAIAAAPAPTTNAVAAPVPPVETTLPPAPLTDAPTPLPVPQAPDASSLTASQPMTNGDADSTPPPTPPPSSVETTPPSPPVITLPPRPMDETEARRQVIVLETNIGDIVIELNDVAAPRTCGNFRKLVASGFYNHTLFHRVIPHFIIQGGDPNSKSDDRRTYGLGDPGYTLPAEIKLKTVAGAVAMARLPDATNPHRDSNGSQFFICAADCPTLNGEYTVFGRVIRGMDAVNKIASQPRDKTDDPLDRIEIQASITTKQQALEANP